MLAKIIDDPPEMPPPQTRQERARHPPLAVHNHGFGVIDHSPAGLVQTETQVNVFGPIKNSLVQEPHLRQCCPANDLTSANHIIDFSRAAMIPVSHLCCSADSLSEGEGKTSRKLVTQGRKKPTGEVELPLKIDKLRSTQADIRVRIHIGK